MKQPYVCIVRRLQDGKQLVAKVDHNPDERKIIEFLHSIIPSSDHIIPLIGSISSNFGPGILLPLRQTVLALFGRAKEHRSRFLPLGEDLIQAVAFLHRHNVAHLDIKPDNLVYTDSFCLELIDFELAIRVDGVDYLTDEVVGTPEFMAPEMHEEDGEPSFYSPILADRWSCGFTVLRILSFSDQEPAGRFQALNSLAHELMSDDPTNRPDLNKLREPSHHIKRDADEFEVDLAQKKPRIEE